MNKNSTKEPTGLKVLILKDKIFEYLNNKTSQEAYINKTLTDGIMSLVQKALPEIARAEGTNQWISVEDRLPKYGQIVLTVHKGVVQHCVYNREIFENNTWKWRVPMNLVGEDLAPSNVFTHWMPLPKSPNKERSLNEV